jgi:UDP-glucose 4-epimerase
MKQRVLVTGGAGYIGSHMLRALTRANIPYVVIDDLSTGFREAVTGAEFIQGSIADRDFLDKIFLHREIDAVIHFASRISVAESISNPAEYYQSNVENSLNLLRAMLDHGVKQLIFSSTAAVYGSPIVSPIEEDHPTAPINPYGRTKAAIEHVLRDYENAYGLRSIILRYFNAAGADPDCSIGERHDPETHLIPLVLQAAAGRRENVKVFGVDYPTPDGTCVRDYVHVSDLCQAHLLALNHLRAAGQSDIYNLGNGEGFSVQQVIDVVKQVTGKHFNVIYEERRQGDPPALVAASHKIRRKLGWSPQYSELSTIVSHAWAWEKNGS